MFRRRWFAAMAGLVVVFLISGDVKAGLINMALAENGGVLERGSEALRDGDYVGTAGNIGGQSGNLWGTITFPEVHIDQINYRMGGATYGNATSYLRVTLRQDGAWSVIPFEWSGANGANYDTGVAKQNNGGAGWDNISGIELWGTIWGSGTGSASATQYEMAAWSDVPEPSVLIGLSGMGVAGLLIVVRRRIKGP